MAEARTCINRLRKLSSVTPGERGAWCCSPFSHSRYSTSDTGIVLLPAQDAPAHCLRAWQLGGLAACAITKAWLKTGGSCLAKVP